METTMMYPVAYCVMTEEEMTYTEGGANLLQAVCAVAVRFHRLARRRFCHPRLSQSTSDQLDQHRHRCMEQVHG